MFIRMILLVLGNGGFIVEECYENNQILCFMIHGKMFRFMSKSSILTIQFQIFVRIACFTKVEDKKCIQWFITHLKKTELCFIFIRHMLRKKDKLSVFDSFCSLRQDHFVMLKLFLVDIFHLHHFVACSVHISILVVL